MSRHVPFPPPSVWDRPEPIARAAPAPISREAIVRAAISLADRDGLEGVSLRKVAAMLKTGAMRLYGYAGTKDELLELMVDAVYAEMVDKPFAGGWRPALDGMARRLRAAACAHPWLVDLLGGRPNHGPHVMSQLEYVLSALGDFPIESAMQALRTVTAYTIGALRVEMAERRAEARTGLDKAAWQFANARSVENLLSSGRFPALVTLVRDAPIMSAEEVFDTGLRQVLDGIALHLPHSDE